MSTRMHEDGAPAPEVTLRPAGPADEPFLARVYASTRAEELAAVDWTEAQKAGFLQMQYDLQRRYYRENFTDTAWNVILCGGQPAGRLYVARWPDEIRIIDIALLPAFRNRGIGSRLIRRLIAEADGSRRPLRIHVERYNPARRLYARLGFEPREVHGVHVLMERPVPVS